MDVFTSTTHEQTLVTNFATSFADKDTHIHQTILTKLLQRPSTPNNINFYHLKLPPPLLPLHYQPLHELKPVTQQEVLDLLSNIPLKSSQLDIVPSTLLKAYPRTILTKLPNLSFSHEGLVRARYYTSSINLISKETTCTIFWLKIISRGQYCSLLIQNLLHQAIVPPLAQIK